MPSTSADRRKGQWLGERPSMGEEACIYQAALDRHAADDLLTKLRAVGELGCTGSIALSRGDDVCVVFLERGAVVDAIVSDGPQVLEGVEAVAYMASRDSSRAVYAPVGHFGKRTIQADQAVLADQVRAVLETGEATEEKRARPRDGGRSTKATGRGDARAGRQDEPAPAAAADAPAVTAPQQKEPFMALESYLDDLKGINGYVAAGIMNYTGEMLVSDSTSKNVDLALVGATFNDIFRSAHEASTKIGLDACRETVISTPNGIVIMRCTGADREPHIHMVAIMKADGNRALMELQLHRLTEKVVEELS